MRVLVVGGNRFVGLELVNRLVVEGHDVSVLALDALPDLVAPHVKWLRADRNDEGALAGALGGATFDAVVDNIAYEPGHVEKLAKALSGRLGHYVLTSSVDIYGLHQPRGFREEDAPLEPSELEGIEGHERYQRGKRACEKAVHAIGVPWTVLRPCVVTGRFDNVPAPSLVGGVAPFEENSRSLFFAARVLDGGPILMRRDDEGLYKLVWVQDVARAAAQAIRDPRMRGEAYNVAGDELWTNERYVRALCQVAGRDADLVWVGGETLGAAHLGDYEPGYGRGPFWSVAPSHKLQALGWVPTSPETWMAKLLESAPVAAQRAGYERRLAEIALAQHVRRRQAFGGRLQPARPMKEPLKAVRPKAAPAPTARPMVAGAFSAEAAAAWVTKVVTPAGLDPTHLRAFEGASASSIGIGTWMGEPDAATDALYVEAITRAVRGGVNVVDTAINYRFMKAERCVGEAIRKLESSGIPRSCLLVSTKGGFVTHDAADPRPPDRYVREEYVARGLMSADEGARRHCIGAKFIAAQIPKSLANLGLERADVYFLHNPELARERLGPGAFLRQLAQTFEVLESAAREGRIGAYGLATWHGLLCAPHEPQHLSLADVTRVAREAGGARHRFKVIQLPFNALRTDAYTKHNQELHGRRLAVLRAAEDLGLYVYTSASVLQGAEFPADLATRLSQAAGGRGPALSALQFARSAPGVGTALVGMRRTAHVDEALSLAREPCIAGPAFDNVCE